MQQAVKYILHTPWSIFAMLSNNLHEIMLFMKDVTIPTHVEEIKLHSEVFSSPKNIIRYDSKTEIIFIYEFLLGIFYLGLARLYERTRDDTIAQVIEASYFAMLSRVSFPYLLHQLIRIIFV